jgi:lycopene beta-cyclase
MYDYIFAGAGCAALSLACALQDTILRDKKILLIDRDAKQQNDRTWCYWTSKETPYDHFATKKWNNIRVQTDFIDLHLPILPYRYQMLRGADFYQWAKEILAQNPQVHWLQADIRSIENTTSGAYVHTTEGDYKGQWVFNSLPPTLPMHRQDIRWYQHFKGWFIKTQKPIFDTNTATFMDFRTPQENEVRFLYVLPTSPTEALVEFTIFGRQVLEPSAYLPPLLAYISEKLGLEADDYTIVEEEFGVIPMTTQKFSAKMGNFIVNIGGAGGCIKASTGFTFNNIQKHTQQILASLLAYGHPLQAQVRSFQFEMYDHILLNVLDRNRLGGSQIFETLFKKHPVQRILRFLDDETNFLEDLQIMASVPSLPFLKAVGEVFMK